MDHSTINHQTQVNISESQLYFITLMNIKNIMQNQTPVFRDTNMDYKGN